VSQRSSFSEKVFPDIMSSGEADARGGDVEIGYDFYVGERFLLGLGFGATFYRGEDLVRTAGRCYSASAELRRETTRGHYFESTEVSTTSSSESSSTTIFTDPNLAYDGAGADIVNDDGSIGAGTADGYSNPYGGYNPVLTIGDATVTRSSESSSSTETTVTKTRGFVRDGTSTAVTRRSRTIDVAAQGDVDTHELRLALQPAWQVAKWFELRGSFGAAATRVSVDVNSTVFLDGAVWGTVSDDDEDWIVTGLCGIDAVVSPFEWLSLFVGADVRFGNNRMNYEAGLVKGEVELVRNTYRAGVAIRF
jgi:hypothetical protein